VSPKQFTDSDIIDSLNRRYDQKNGCGPDSAAMLRARQVAQPRESKLYLKTFAIDVLEDFEHSEQEMKNNPATAEKSIFKSMVGKVA
ncbi:unnamed protein product, partial [Amoebophrya sp. A120]